MAVLLRNISFYITFILQLQGRKLPRYTLVKPPKMGLYIIYINVKIYKYTDKIYYGFCLFISVLYIQIND